MTTETNGNLPSLIAEVSAKLARIEKRGTAPSQMGGFSFVRETDVMDALKPELDARGIVLRPDVELLRLDTFARSGKDMPNTVATISLALYAVRGLEEYLISRTVGQGADTQDKAVGKAVTAAKKQAILIAFAIPTGDDPDASAIPDRARNKQPQAGERSNPMGSEAPAMTPPVTDPEVIALKRVEWAAQFGWSGPALRQAALDATNVALGELDTDDWRIFAAAVVKAGPGLPAQPVLPLDQGTDAGSDSLAEPEDTSAPEPEAVAPPSAPPVPPAEPPQPGTDEYKALPVQEKAKARAHWAVTA